MKAERDTLEFPRLYREALVVDTTAPIAPFSTIQTGCTPCDIVDVYPTSGVTLAVFTVVDDYPNSIEQTVKLIAQNRRFFRSQPDKYQLVESAAEVEHAKRAGKLAVAFAFQGSNALLGELALVEVYRRLGVIQMLLAYNAASLAADGCHERRNAGLTDFGRDLIAEMNRVGMIVDVTHLGIRSSLEAIEVTTKPPIFSHSTPRKFVEHDRNITDEQIRACARKNGVIGLTGLGLFMDAGGAASSARIAETIDYVVQMVGSAHAAIGLDYVRDADAMARYICGSAGTYGGGSQYPTDGRVEFSSPAVLPEVTEHLMRRGYSDDAICAILGRNYLRVLEAHQPLPQAS